MFDKAKFATRLKQLRGQRKLSVYALANATRISPAAIYQFERSKSYPHCNTLCTLADYFNVSLDYLVGRSDTPYMLKDDDVEMLSPQELAVLRRYRDSRNHR